MDPGLRTIRAGAFDAGQRDGRANFGTRSFVELMEASLRQI
jgi:hypothetical protein